MSSVRRSSAAAALTVTVAALAWGVLAFGSPYPWAYRPLAAASVTAAILAVAATRRVSHRALAATLAVIALAIGAQLIPLSRETLASLNPRSIETITSLDLIFANTPDQPHPLSIKPAATLTALGLFLAFASLTLGLASLFARTGAERVIAAIAVVGAVIAMIAIVQKPLYRGLIYGFWKPESGWDAFGPFVNRNHFAGWMLMALPLTLGLFASRLRTARKPHRRDLRSRLVWLSSPDAGGMLLLAGAAIVMSLSLALTFSRSGILGFLFIIVVSAVTYVRHAAREARRGWVILAFATLAAGAIAWAGVGPIVERFQGGDGISLGSRAGIWADALRIAERASWTGIGINTFGQAMLLYQTYNADILYYSSAHNDYLQLWVEGGLLVTVPIAVAAVTVAVSAWRRLKEDRGQPYYWIRAGAVTGLVAIALQEAVDFSLQMPGNAVLFAVLIAIAIHCAAAAPHDAAFRAGPDGDLRRRGRDSDHAVARMAGAPRAGQEASFPPAAPVVPRVSRTL